ncbi:MAG: TA system antitoxin ParD family protein [Desulfobacteria bacterium]
MGMPVKLSDALVREARDEARIVNRSITGQIEHWASLGRAVEVMLKMPDIRALKHRKFAADESSTASGIRSRVLDAIHRVVSTSDRKAIKRRIAAAGGPIYESDPNRPGRIVRIAPDGTRTPGRFKGRSFIPAVANQDK